MVKLMTVQQTRHSEEKFAQCNNEIYESQIRSPLKTDNHRKIGAIALETEAFEVDASAITARDHIKMG
jgi:hypothetical protein